MLTGIRDRIDSASVRYLLARKGAEIGTDLRAYGFPITSLADGSRLVLHDRVVLCSRSSRTALGIGHPVILRTLTAHAEIDIGSDTGLSGVTICSARSVRIGARALVGADVLIADTNFHPLEWRDRRFAAIPPDAEADQIIIEDDVFIGARSVILKGVSLGAGSVIGAGSVVTRSFGARSVVAGSPAKLLRVLDI